MIQDEDERSKILLEAQSPACDITAFVEDDGEAIYFYLYGPQEVIPQGMDPESFIPVRTCFVTNKKHVPEGQGFEVAPILSRNARRAKHARSCKILQ